MLEIWLFIVGLSSFVLGFLTCLVALAFMAAQDISEGLRND